ncbi:hypothetical protein J4H86_18835 [Spiractinospora alimapuensis]|uniref:tetratricopeptide repeat protein n=1 Tax=Spiractinospora alimapuensis TaxID=2820884 RepID=UPI001F31698C|nr:hypothetical protein [Spiractinospora alimapuensis]QVQ50900.1 hypothetical protein J4H86_18835 [Spiractinospora alimapuensis]
MPLAGDLTTAQNERRSRIISTLTAAGWASDTILWDAGIATDFVASVSLRRFGWACKCDYVVASEPGGLPEYLDLQWNTPEAEVRVFVDFLGPSGRGTDTLTTVLDVLVQSGRHEQYTDRLVPATIATLLEVCQVFVHGDGGRLRPLTSQLGDGEDHDDDLHSDDRPTGRGTVTTTEATASGGTVTATTWHSTPDEDITYADPVEDRLHKALTAVGWRTSPDEAQLRDELESFYVDRGSLRISAGNLHINGGVETRVRVSRDDSYFLLKVDGINRPEDADRLIEVLRSWQHRLTEDNLLELGKALFAAYATVHRMGQDDEWHRVRHPDAPRSPAPAPAGADARSRHVGARLEQAGWFQTQPGRPATVSRALRTGHGTTLRVDHMVGVLPTLAESLRLTVWLPEGEESTFGSPAVFDIDVFDLGSGRGNRDQLATVLDVIGTHQNSVRCAKTLGSLLQSLSLLCPIHRFDVATNESTSFLLSVDWDPDNEWSESTRPPAPRALLTVERQISSDPAGGSAALWFERGVAALADDQPHLALEGFNAAIQRDSRHAPARFQRARLLRLVGADHAGSEYRQCVELGYEVGPALIEHAKCLSMEGRGAEGLTLLEELTRRLPDYFPGWYQKAATAHTAGRHELAVAAATSAARLQPRHANTFWFRAAAYAQLGDVDAAIEDIAATLKLKPSLRSEIRDDTDFEHMRTDERFVSVVDPRPEPERMDRTLADVLWNGGWRPDDMDIQRATFTSLEYPCPAGRLIVSQFEDEVFVNLRPRGGEADEAWLYTPVGDPTDLGALLVAWQDALSPDYFPYFAEQANGRVEGVSWHWGHP